jgi:ankyrin repeat protein
MLQQEEDTIQEEDTVQNYQEKLKFAAWASNFEEFEKNWKFIVELYLQDKTQIDESNPSLFNTIFNYAIKGGNAKIVRLMLQSKLILTNDFIDINVRSPLTIAIFENNKDLVNVLLESGIFSIWNKKTAFDCSPVWEAIIRDFSHDKESAYYLNLLFNNLNKESQSDLLEKFKSDYLVYLFSRGRRQEAEWTLNFLLKKDYLNVEDLIKNEIFCSVPVFHSRVFSSDPGSVPVDEYDELSDIEESKAARPVSQHSNTKKSSDFQLNPTQLNNLLLSYMEGPAAKKDDYRVDEGMIKTTRQYTVTTHYKKLSKENQPLLYIFEVVRDSKNGREANLAFINDVVLAFFKEHGRKNGTLLFPMAQSRWQLAKKKKHYVLVEITPEKIMLHNSQSLLSTKFYLNCLNDLKLGEVIARNYDQQQDSFSCGFFVYNYIVSILKTGNSDQLATIRVTLNNMVSNPDFLKELLNANLEQMKSDARKIEASGDSLPWEKKSLEKVLTKNYANPLFETMNYREEAQAADNNSEAQSSSNAYRLSVHGLFREARYPVSTLEAIPPSVISQP